MLVREMILKMEERTPMYIGAWSITRFNAFLRGWSIGAGDQVEDLWLMSDFQDWIAKRFSITSSHGWAEIILFYSQDEADALKTFYNLFHQFLSVVDEKSSKNCT